MNTHTKRKQTNKMLRCMFLCHCIHITTGYITHVVNVTWVWFELSVPCAADRGGSAAAISSQAEGDGKAGANPGQERWV